MTYLEILAHFLRPCLKLKRNKTLFHTLLVDSVLNSAIRELSMSLYILSMTFWPQRKKAIFFTLDIPCITNGLELFTQDGALSIRHQHWTIDSPSTLRDKSDGATKFLLEEKGKALLPPS